MGNLALCRFHSKHVALQIKAIEEKKFGTRYGQSIRCVKKIIGMNCECKYSGLRKRFLGCFTVTIGHRE